MLPVTVTGSLWEPFFNPLHPISLDRIRDREGGRAKLDYRKILEEEALRNGVKVFFHNKGAQWGRAVLRSKRIFVPNPVGFTSFFTGLHELGHIMSGHLGGDGKPEYIWEFEAFRWALEFCENRGIKVPARTVMNERDIIAEKMKEEADGGAKKLAVSVVRFVKEGDDVDPDVKFVRKFVKDDGTIISSGR